MKIYLAGFVPKGDKEAKIHIDWRSEFINHLTKIVDAEFIDPRDRGRANFDEGDPFAVFALDCKRVRQSDLILVNGDSLSVGGAQEILIAKYFKKPVIVVLPKNTVHRRTNLNFGNKVIEDWIHPFIHSTCDLMVESIEELTAQDLKKVFKNPKTIKLIDEAVNACE